MKELSYLNKYFYKYRWKLIRNIYSATRHVLQKSREEGITTYEAAKQLAEKRIVDISKLKRL